MSPNEMAQRFYYYKLLLMCSGHVIDRGADYGGMSGDLWFYTKGRLGNYIVNSPMILGHETAGVVSKLGLNVTSLREGQARWKGACNSDV